jgi:hypothetical protein
MSNEEDNKCLMALDLGGAESQPTARNSDLSKTAAAFQTLRPQENCQARNLLNGVTSSNSILNILISNNSLVTEKGAEGLDTRSVLG